MIALVAVVVVISQAAVVVVVVVVVRIGGGYVRNQCSAVPLLEKHQPTSQLVEPLPCPYR